MSVLNCAVGSENFVLKLGVTLVCVCTLSACGNKGDLFLIPDAMTQEDLLGLEQVLNADDIPTASPTEIDDDAVFIEIEPLRREVPKAKQ